VLVNITVIPLLIWQTSKSLKESADQLKTIAKVLLVE